MNRNELIDYIRDPASLTSDHLDQLEAIVAESPYFQSARLLLAKGSAILNEPATKKRVSSAAIYATDRLLLKKYISGNLLFLTRPPSQKTEVPETASTTTAGVHQESAESGSQATADTNQEKDGSALTTVAPTDDKLFIPGIPVGALDAILDELEQDIEDLKFSRSKFAVLQDQLEDEEDPRKASEEIEAEKTSEVQAKSKETEEIQTEEISKSEISETSTESNDSDLPEIIVEEEKIEDSEPPEQPSDKDTEEENENEIVDSPTEAIDTIAPLEESSSTEEKSLTDEDTEEEDEMEKAIVEKLKNLQKQEPTKIVESEKEQLPDAIVPEVETPLEIDPAREVKIESDIKREQRMEKRLEREKRLSSLNKLSETSIKKLEDQMWGDSDEDANKITEKEKSAHVENKDIADKEGVSPAKKTTEEVAHQEETKEKAAENPVKKATVKKPAVKKTEAKQAKTKKAEVKKTTTKKPATKKAATTKKPASTKKPSATKATATRKTATKGTTKKNTTKKVSPKKKNDPDGKSDRPKKQDKLIEKFISENPSISKGAKKPKSDGDLSTKSATWNKELASEYLAEIYLNQGNKKRAIEIYKVLSLKFPQKKSYFADLISKIK